MGPFYAYVTNRESGNDSRLILIFANRAVADEWWREISKDPILSNIQRFAPQFYSYDSSEVNLSQFFYCHKEIADKFVNRMTIQSENDGSYSGRSISTVPSVDITDHVSGNRYAPPNLFYIRSRLDPRLYWFYQPNSRFTLENASSGHNNRTAFRITAFEEPEGTIMIGKDKITISVMPQVHITVDADGFLIARGGDASTWFTSEDFSQGKFSCNQNAYLMHDQNNPVQEEIWELVHSHSTFTLLARPRNP